MNILGVIPARYASSRFPGKPLAMIAGASMIHRVCRQASQAERLSELLVATDDERIAMHVSEAGFAVRMTRSTHTSGTDRIAEVVSALEAEGRSFDAVVNIQGDEPLLDPRQIDELCAGFERPGAEIVTLARPVTDESELDHHDSVKVVCGQAGQALYFSRLPIPFQRGIEAGARLSHFAFLKHIGLYGFLTPVLDRIARLDPHPLEMAESLEQLRWLANGYRIFVTISRHESPSVDRPEDIDRVTEFLRKHPTL